MKMDSFEFLKKIKPRKLNTKPNKKCPFESKLWDCSPRNWII